MPVNLRNSPSPSLLERRRQRMGPTYKLFYEDPINMVRAAGSWMYDDVGRQYLDAYNNVPVVGHCHPKVVGALAAEAAVLNTNTRYLHAKIVDLAERLLGTMPDEIGQMVFTCTGSESNDFACRIAKVSTGGTAFIVTENAYHGVTALTSALSPLNPGKEGLEGATFTVPPPSESNPAAFAHDMRQTLDRISRAGLRPAALMIDSVFASDGVIADPPGIIDDAVRAVRAAGGLYIADEVQSGFGRTGQMWGFQRHGVVPDMVTMGKPMGNGHPMGAVAARPDLLAAFSKVNGYFNTFGGNNVAAAVGLAVLDVIEEERLVENAAEVGGYIKRQLAGFLDEFGFLKAIRGAGLYLGIEMAEADERADAKDMNWVLNEARRRMVLLGSVGRKKNVLRIRPPLCLTRNEADMLLATLREVFSLYQPVSMG